MTVPKRRRFRDGNHASERAAQRYRVRPSAEDYENIRAQIVQGKAKLLDYQVTRGVYQAELQGQKCWVVYHYIKRKVVTFLPRNPLQLKNGSETDSTA